MTKLRNTVKKGITVAALSLVVMTAAAPAVQADAAVKAACSTSTKSARSFTSGKLCYNVTSSNTVTCTGLKANCSNTTSVSIPSTVSCNGKTYKVTKVANNAFKNNDCLKTVNVSNNVKSIGTNSFSGCDSLKNVKLGNCVKSVGSNAFSNCPKLNTVNGSSKIKSLGNNCFGNASYKMSK